MERPQPAPSTARRRPGTSTSSKDVGAGSSPSFAAYLAVCLVSAGCQLATKAFWIELPAMLVVTPTTTTLATHSSVGAAAAAASSSAIDFPEVGSLSFNDEPSSNLDEVGTGGLRWTLSVEHQARLFALVVVTSNAAACFFYLAAGRICSRHRRPVETRAVWASLVIGVASLSLAAGGFEFGSRLENGVFLAEEIPLVAVLVGAALGAVGATTGGIALLSVIGQLGAVTTSGGGGAASYVCAAMFGDALASMVPRSLAIAQGIGRTPENKTSVVMETNNDTSTAGERSSVYGILVNDDVTVTYRSEAIVGSRVSHRFHLSSSSYGGSGNRQYHQSSSRDLQAAIIGMYEVADPHFSESVYFIACSAFILIGALSFAALRCCVCCGGVGGLASEPSENAGGGVSTIASGFGFRLPFGRLRNNPTGSTVSVPVPSPRSCAGGNDRRPNITFAPLVTSSPTRKPETSGDAIGGNSTAKPEGASASTKYNTTITILDDGTERQATGYTASAAASSDVITVASNTSAAAADYSNADSTSNSGPHLPVLPSTKPQSRPTGLTADIRPTAKSMPFGSRGQRLPTAPPGAGRPKLFQLLIAIVLLTSIVLSGILSDVLAHANYPTGSWTFAVGAAGCDVVSAVACIVAARATARSEMSTVIAMTCLGTIVLTYFGALVAFGQHVGVGRSAIGATSGGLPGGTVDAALMMGSTGEYLAVAAWVTIVAVFSFARVRIGVECRLAGPEALFWYACALRIGDVIGSTAAIGQISVGRFFKRHIR